MEKDNAGTGAVVESSTSVTGMLKRPWVVIASFVTALALLLTNINSILANVRALPGEVRKTSEQFHEWYGDYGAWKGHWTNFPEGRVDMAQLHLAEEDFRISIDDVKSGELAGSIETKNICEKTPYFEQLLFDGTVSNSHHANIAVFEYVGGYRRVFATVELQRDAGVMTIDPVDDPMGLFSKGVRIALDPDEFRSDPDRQPICAKKNEVFIKRALEAVEKRPGRAGAPR